ncbi:MAG TPA: hypothetical protein VFB59_04820 [Candidatus Saccharimonadales bacterium]|nr:hypothetical protein [Candidatus Saccharimonadales bacterium]
MAITETLHYDFTPELPSGEYPIDYFLYAADLGNETLRLFSKLGNPTKVDLVYNRKDTSAAPHLAKFWVPPGVIPVFSAEKQDDDSFDVEARLPGFGDVSVASVNAARYNIRLPEEDYCGMRAKLFTLERTFYALTGSNRGGPTGSQLELPTAIKSISKAVSALAISKPLTNGTYTFNVIHG